MNVFRNPAPFWLFVLCNTVCISCNPKPANAQEKTVVRLPIVDGVSLGYHGSTNALSKTNTEGYPAHGRFLCTDSRGNLYVSDRISPGHIQIRCYNEVGVFVKAWQPLKIPIGDIGPVAVDGRGVVWVGIDLAGRGCPGLPVVAYDKAHWEPILDWRHEAPPFIETKFALFLAKYAWKQKGNWTPLTASASRTQVLFEFYGPTVPSEGSFLGCISLLTDGKSTASIAKLGAHEEQSLTAQGLVRHVINDASLSTEWKEVTSWTGPQTKTNLSTVSKIVLENAKMTAGMQAKAKQQEGTVPYVLFDNLDNTYVVWSHRVSMPTAIKWTYSMDVISRDGHLVYTQPWTTPMKWLKEWIAPMPDGSGFYRARDDDRQLIVDFVPLNRK